MYFRCKIPDKGITNLHVLNSIADSKKIKYEYITFTDNDEAIKFLEKVNNGKRIIPTLDIDGEIYTNPGISNLIKIIGE